MEGSTNIAMVVFTLKDGKKLKNRLQFSNSQLAISDTFMLSLLEKHFNIDAQDISSCEIELGANNIAVNIRNYTLTDIVYFSAFYDKPSIISIFQSRGTNIHVVGQRIELMQVDCQSIFLADCYVKKLDIGLAEHSEMLRLSSQSKDAALATAYKMKSIDIRGCQILRAEAFVECDNISIQECSIDSFCLYGGFNSSLQAVIKWLNISEYTEIKALEVHCRISDLMISKSTLLGITATANCLLDDLTIEDSLISNTYNFSRKHFRKMSMHSWMFISKSEEKKHNLGMKAEANYQIAKIINKNECGFRRIAGTLFGFCTGYGYKPILVWRSCAFLVFIAFLMFTVIDLIWGGNCSVALIFHNIAISVAALAGQSGLQIANGIKFWVAMAEYVFGVVLFAMFVNALYVRYRD